jgi:DDE superfamily endonuclease
LHKLVIGLTMSDASTNSSISSEPSGTDSSLRGDDGSFSTISSGSLSDLGDAYVLTGDEFMQHGLLLLGWTERQLDRNSKRRREKHTAWFKAEFGCSGQVVAQIFEDLQTTDIQAARIDNAALEDASHLLYALAFMKSYPTEEQRQNKWHLCDRVLRDSGWDMLKRLQALKAKKIMWPTDDEIGNNIFIGSVDGTHVKTNEPSHPQFPKDPKAYSYKNKAAGLSYEIVVSISKSKIIWMNGPFLAAINDSTIFDTPGGLREKLEGTGCRLIGDSGYGGYHEWISRLSSHDSPEVSKFKTRVRMRHEAVNGKIKTFRCVDSARFRHGEEKFKIAFEASVVVTQYKMDISEPLFDV